MQDSLTSQRRRSLLLAAGVTLVAPLAAHAQAISDEIVIGGSIPMTGVFSFAGIGINAGISDYVKIVNDAGGVNDLNGAAQLARQADRQIERDRIVNPHRLHQIVRQRRANNVLHHHIRDGAVLAERVNMDDIFVSDGGE